MKTTHDQNGSAGKWVVILALTFTTLLSATGCDDLAALTTLAGTLTSLGEGVSTGGYGTENVWTWGGLANPWYTSSLGLPEMPGYYWSHQ